MITLVSFAAFFAAVFVVGLALMVYNDHVPSGRVAAVVEACIAALFIFGFILALVALVQHPDVPSEFTHN